MEAVKTDNTFAFHGHLHGKVKERVLREEGLTRGNKALCQVAGLGVPAGAVLLCYRRKMVQVRQWPSSCF